MKTYMTNLINKCVKKKKKYPVTYIIYEISVKVM